DFMKASERHRVQKILRRVMKTGRSTELEYTTYINNSQQWYKNSVGPIFTDGRITGLVLSTFDISQERLALKKLEEQKKAAEAAKIQAQTLLSSIGEGLLVIDEHGVIASVNSSAAAALGYDVKTLTGKWFPGTVLALDDQGKSIDPLNRPATQALMSGRSISETVWYQRKDGSVFPVAVTVSPVILDGRPVGAIEVFRDLTNERELERAKEEFVSLASHQLRTPATGAKAFISLLLDGYAGKLSERQKEYMQKIRKANERQLEIINDMLNVARIDSGRIMPEMVSADIAEILEDIIEVHQPVAMERSQRLELILPSHRSAVVCDPKLIHMALENIVNNASKYTHKGGSIGVSLRFSENQAHVRVEDTGVGIAVEDQSKIFQRFARVYNPLSVARGGTGLGLYLTRNIVDMHQGRIGVDSKPGAGTIFDIELPLQPIGSLAQFADNQVTLGREK
ncbi:MAG TPA: PAS domain-containing sensor histidine kinase, partial [Candidatus Saccharimonadia bacterium]